MVYSKPLYGILGIYMPLSIQCLWAPMPGLIFRLFAPDRFVSFNETLWCFIGFCSALAASFYARLFKKSMLRHSINDVRGSILVTILAYVFVSMFRELPLAARFLPSVNSVISAFSALFAWFSVNFLSEVFGGLELFDSFTAQHKGEQLRAVMLEFAPEMAQTHERLKSLRKSYCFQFIPPCLLLSVPGFSRNSVSISVLVFVIFSIAFLLLGFLGLKRRELGYASEGVTLTIRDRVLPIPVMALGICIAALLALTGSSETSILPPQIILAFFALIGRLLGSLFKPIESTDLPMQAERNMGFSPMNLGEMFPEPETSGPWPGWVYVRYAFLALLVFLFLLFMIYPLLRRGKSKLNAGVILAMIARWFSELKKGILAFIGALRDRGAALRMPDQEKLQRIASQLLPEGARRKDKRSVNLFARLVLWGIETLGVQWKPSFAPGEYCGLMAAALPTAAEAGSETDSETAETPPETPHNIEIRSGIFRSGELFEKAIYSLRRLSAEEEKEYKQLIDDITGYEQ